MDLSLDPAWISAWIPSGSQPEAKVDLNLYFCMVFDSIPSGYDLGTQVDFNSDQVDLNVVPGGSQSEPHVDLELCLGPCPGTLEAEGRRLALALGSLEDEGRRPTF